MRVKRFVERINTPYRANGESGLSQVLFRQEVIEAKRGEWLGSIIVATPLSRWGLAALALIVVAAIALFPLFGHYTRRETVTGQLVPSAGVLTVAAPGVGTLTRRCAADNG